MPSVDYLAALAVILASGAAALTQVAVLVMFNVVAFALVEIPLLAYLLAPKATATSMTALHDWIRSRRRRDVAILLAAVGCAFLAVGTSGLISARLAGVGRLNIMSPITPAKEPQMSATKQTIRFE